MTQEERIEKFLELKERMKGKGAYFSLSLDERKLWGEFKKDPELQNYKPEIVPAENQTFIPPADSVTAAMVHAQTGKMGLDIQSVPPGGAYTNRENPEEFKTMNIAEEMALAQSTTASSDFTGSAPLQVQENTLDVSTTLDSQEQISAPQPEPVLSNTALLEKARAQMIDVNGKTGITVMLDQGGIEFLNRDDLLIQAFKFVLDGDARAVLRKVILQQ